MISPDRFFSATAMAGRLHMVGIADPGPWNAARVAYIVERDLDAILPRMVAVKVKTVGQLDAEIARAKDRPGSTTLYVHEDLLGVARARWERMREDLP